MIGDGWFKSFLLGTWSEKERDYVGKIPKWQTPLQFGKPLLSKKKLGLFFIWEPHGLPSGSPTSESPTWWVFLRWHFLSPSVIRKSHFNHYVLFVLPKRYLVRGGHEVFGRLGTNISECEFFLAKKRSENGNYCGNPPKMRTFYSWHQKLIDNYWLASA